MAAVLADPLKYNKLKEILGLQCILLDPKTRLCWVRLGTQSSLWYSPLSGTKEGVLLDVSIRYKEGTSQSTAFTEIDLKQ